MDAVRVSIEQHGTTVVVRLRGGLLLHAAPRVRAQLSDIVDEHPRQLVADLREVPEIDSSGLALLLWVYRSQAARNCRFVVVTDNAMVLRAFEVTRLDDVLDVRRTMPAHVG